MGDRKGEESNARGSEFGERERIGGLGDGSDGV